MTMAREVIACPYAKSDMTPCVARDGQMCVADEGMCVGCERMPADMLRDLVKKYVERRSSPTKEEMEFTALAMEFFEAEERAGVYPEQCVAHYARAVAAYRRLQESRKP
jgi:hypothetical protein